MVRIITCLILISFIINDTYSDDKKEKYGIRRVMRENASYKGDNPNLNKYDIKRCLELSVEFDKDTVSFGDELSLTVTFKNRTDSVQFFYPKVVLFLIRFMDTFGSHNLYVSDNLYVDKTWDLSNYQKLEPKETYSIEYKILVTSEFFFKGENCCLYLEYICWRALKSSK